jgi:hypothetical protein
MSSGSLLLDLSEIRLAIHSEIRDFLTIAHPEAEEENYKEEQGTVSKISPIVIPK